MATSLIREARERAGLTQQQLAERSGIAQSTISAYESGKREPGVAAMDVLLAACGFELTLRERMPTPAQAGRILYEAIELADAIQQGKRRMESQAAPVGT